LISLPVNRSNKNPSNPNILSIGYPAGNAIRRGRSTDLRDEGMSGAYSTGVRPCRVGKVSAGRNAHDIGVLGSVNRQPITQEVIELIVAVAAEIACIIEPITRRVHFGDKDISGAGSWVTDLCLKCAGGDWKISSEGVAND